MRDDDASVRVAETAAEVLRKAFEEEWLLVDEVALLWRIPRRTVYHMIEKGALESQRFGRYVRVTSSSVKRLNTPASGSA